MTDNAKRIFGFLKDLNGEKCTQKDIVTALGVVNAAVTGTVNGLCKKGYAVRDKVESTDAEGKKITTTYIWLTEEGLNFDPEAPVAADAE